MIAEPLDTKLANDTCSGSDALRPVTLRPGNVVSHRLRDIVVAAVGLVLLAPLFLAIAILIRATTRGPILFRQQRCGTGGELFACYKFRTMVPDAHWVLENDAALRESFARQWKLVDDPRVTPVGRFLRKSSLDELPQLWNVLKGDMSLVGPRPVQPNELRDQYGRHAAIVTLVRPGMTGLWQVSGRSTLPYEARVALDVQYVRHRSFWFDLLILIRTIPAILVSRGAQ